jgi:flagellar hook-associated protein 2
MTTTFAVAGPSGLDINSMIDSLVSIEQNKVTVVQNQKNADQVKINAYNNVRGLLSDLKTKADALSDPTSFNVFKATSTDAVTIAGTSTSVEGQYDVNVSQTAASEKMISADGKITSLTASLASQGVTVGDISVAGVKITVGANDTLNDLRSKINSAVDASGNKIGASASVIKVADNDYRLIIAATSTGSAGVAYQDLTGSALQDLGIITDANGDKGSANQSLTSTDSIVSAWNALATGGSISYEGTDHEGTAVSNTYVKTAGSTINDFLAQIKATFNNEVTASTDSNGLLDVADAIGGVSKLAISKLTIGDADHAMKVSATGTLGKGVLSAGRDAYFSIDGMQMTTTSNTVDGVIPGTTFTLNSVTSGTPVTVGLTKDLDTITSNVQALLTSYNNLADYATQAVKIADPSVQGSTDGDLAGDMTLESIVSNVLDVFHKSYNLLGGNLTSMTMVGLNSDPQTGDLSLDTTKFQNALTSNMQAVQNLFTTVGTSDNNAITLGQNTADTQSGSYELKEVDPTHLQIRQKGTNAWYTSEARVGDVVIFDQGPAKGLALSSPVGAITGSSTFTLSKGVSTTLDETLTQMMDPNSGIVAIQQSSLQSSMQDADNQIATLTDQVTNYRNRLVTQFSNMETALSQIKQQGSSITNALGTTSTAAA